MLSIFHVLLTLLMVVLILLFYYNSLAKLYNDKNKSKRKVIIVAIGLAIWFGYLTLLSKTDLLYDLSLPPKFPILIFLPIIIFTIIFYFKNRGSQFIKSIPLAWTTYYQTFRIAVELLLLFTFYKGLIPKTATFEGLNFDILMGISSPFVAYFLLKDVSKNRTLLSVWNILGIFMVLFVVLIIASSFFQPQIWDSETTLVKNEFFEMPYLLVAGFLAPSAIFIHIVSLMQLKK